MDKELWLIWKNPKNDSRRRYKVGKLSFLKGKYYFEYSDDIDIAIRDGFTLYPGFNDVGEKYESDSLFENIESRIPDKKRHDYLDIINIYNLSPNATNIEILAATKGRLPTDNFEFVQAIDGSNRLEFNIAGIRHRAEDLSKCATKLNTNTKLELRHNPNNEYDKNAVEVHYMEKTSDYLIGYVPRYYAKFLSEHLDNGANYSALVKRVIKNPQSNDDKYSVEVKIIIE